MAPWLIETETKKGQAAAPIAERLADEAGLLSFGQSEPIRANITGALYLTQKLDSLEAIKKAFRMWRRMMLPVDWEWKHLNSPVFQAVSQQ
jgi:hypothetical protein